MGVFSYLSAANEDELCKRYWLVNRLKGRLKDFIIPRMPDYVYGTVGSMGVPGYDIQGCWIQVPSLQDGITPAQFKKALNRCKNFGAEVIVIDPSILADPGETLGFTVSSGSLFPPFAFIEGLRTVSALMGMDFKRANICIVDAAADMGIKMAEILSNEVTYLTLCTKDRKVLDRYIDGFIQKTGLSPAVVSNYKKAVSSCDILIYTGNADMGQISSFVNRKMLIANITTERIRLEKDLLAIDEIILHSANEPQITGEGIESDIFMTSRIWEGALLTVLGNDLRGSYIDMALRVYKLSKDIGLKIKSVVSSGKPIDRYSIYNYR